jgi:acetyl esterase/lipase
MHRKWHFSALSSMGFYLMAATALAQPLPIEDYMANPAFRTAKISPDGKYIALAVPRLDTDVLLVSDIETQAPLTGFETEQDTGIADFWWVNEERLVLNTFVYRNDIDRPLNTGNLFAFNIDNSKRLAIAGPRTGEYAAYAVLDTLRSDFNNILVTRWPIDARGAVGTTVRSKPEAYLLNVYEAPLQERTGSRLGDNRLNGAITSPLPWGDLHSDSEGEVRLATATNDEGKFEASIRENSVWKSIDLPFANDDDPTDGIGQLIGFGPENKGIYYLARSEYGTTALAYYDLTSSESTILFRHEKYDIGAADLIWTSDESEVIGVKVVGALPENYYFSEHPEVSFHRSLDKGMPGFNLQLLGFSDNGKKALAMVNNATTPDMLFLLDRDKGEFGPLFYAYPKLLNTTLSDAEPIALTARDGVALEGYVTRGYGVTGPAPMIVLPHGGPHGTRDVPFFDPEVQLLASRGYSVLQINYRGSGGYGSSFAQKGYRNWGTTMVDDVIDATEWAITNGYAEPGNICIMGASYGGYSAMMAVARYPELFTCGVGISGVYDLNLMRKGDIPFIPGGERFLEQVVGSDEAVLAQNSPIAFAGNIKIPILLAHGNRDLRVPIKNAERFRDALKDAGVEHEWLLLRNTGHSPTLPETKVELYTEVLKFLDRSLKTPGEN